MRSDTGRDPLGLQPVWSEFGRRMVPYLAGPVVQLKGVTAVLLIHYIYEKMFAQDSVQNQVNYRGYFRLMEGLLEWYLWKHCDQQHCFGTHTFSSGASFSVKAKDDRTLVNGLYQYYRGTCRRAKLLSGDWIVESDVAAALQNAWSDEVSAQLKPVLGVSLKDDAQPMAPIHLLKQCPGLIQSLEAVFNSQALNQILYKSLFGAEPYMKIAEYCSEMLQATPHDDDRKGFGRTYSWVKKLDTRLANCAVARPLLDNLKHIDRCEPFLITVQDGFDYLRCSSGLSISKVATALAEYRNVIRDRSKKFIELNDVAKNARSSQMLNVAKAAVGGVDDFLRAILKHHASVSEDRGRDPMALLEGDTILSLATPERTTEDILLRLKNGYPWDNGYYLATAGNLYQQAKQAVKAVHV